jgi:hypothetical protein
MIKHYALKMCQVLEAGVCILQHIYNIGSRWEVIFQF